MLLTLEGKGLDSVLRMERVKNYDGTPAMTLRRHEKIDNPYFWKKFDELVEFLKAKKIPLMDFSPDNIMVKKISDNQFIPVIVDYKRMSRRNYLFQPSIWLLKGAVNKMLRRAERIRRTFSTQYEKR